MSRHPILFLNGTSSAGKTTVARAFQKLWHDPVLYASIDSFIFMFADHVLKNDELRKVALWPLISAFNKSLPNIAATGFPVIIDYVMESRVWLDECLESLQDYEVYFIGVKCPLEELERREIARGDRQIGFARWQHERVHCYGPYDLEIDTSTHSPEECATQLRDLLLSGKSPQAFDRLRVQQIPASTQGVSPSETQINICLFENSIHREGTVVLWKNVFGYETAHNEPNLAIDRKLAVHDELFFVAVEDGAVIGSIMAGYDGHRGWLYSVAVSLDHRHRGLGSALVRRAEQALAALGCLKINLQIVEENGIVQIFYKSLGYVVEARLSMGKRMTDALPSASPVGWVLNG